MKHAHVACGSLWMLISLVIPALILSHAISPPFLRVIAAYFPKEIKKSP